MQEILSFLESTNYWNVFTLSAVAISLFFILSPYGKLTMGKGVEIKTLPWIAMMFSCSLATGLIYWAIPEPIGHLAYAKNEIEATGYMFINWGVHVHAVFAVCGAAIGYFVYNKGTKINIRDIIAQITPNKYLQMLCEIIAVLATTFCVIVPLQAGAVLLNSSVDVIMGESHANYIPIFVVLISVISLLSALSGVKRGIKIISVINVLISVFLLIGFVLSDKSGLGLIKYATDSTVYYLNPVNFIQLSFDEFGGKAGIFAWITCNAPVIGMFYARISKGRSLREFFLGAVIAPVAMTFIWMYVVSGQALEFHSQGIKMNTVFDLINAQFNGIAVFIAVVYAVSVMLYTVTSIDSSITSVVDELGNKKNKVRNSLITFAVFTALGLFISLMGNDTVSLAKNLLTFTGVPFSIVLIFMVYAWLKQVYKDAK